MKTKIAVYTSTRADFGILKPLIQQLISAPDFEVRIFVTGTHLEKDFGYTVTEIEKYFPQNIFYLVQHAMKEDPRLKNLKVMGELIPKYSEALVENLPEIAVVLGDRYEALCFGLVCASLNIPFAHLHGGELTLGAIDDKFRHCLTKLANWHFVACEKYRERVIQLGEKPEKVFNVGALGVENALNEKLMLEADLEKDLGISFKQDSESYLFTFHPETNSVDCGEELLKSFLQKLAQRISSHHAKVIMTGVNSDPGAEKIKKLIQDFQNQFPQNVIFRESLGMLRYLSVMKKVTAVLGNSSSGILEAYSLGTPAVNLGSRQAGRERESSVIDLANAAECSSFDFSRLVQLKKQLMTSDPKESIFGNGQTSQKVVAELQNVSRKRDFSIVKEFYDLP